MDVSENYYALKTFTFDQHLNNLNLKFIRKERGRLLTFTYRQGGGSGSGSKYFGWMCIRIQLRRIVSGFF